MKWISCQTISELWYDKCRKADILVMTDSFSSLVVTLLITSVSPSGKGIRAIGDE
uniref:hypothetical protein n=1 Tax=Bacteroides stercoris TaxID=46506 RepID=UPI003566825E